MDAYEWVFLDRLQSLQAQLQSKPQIEGLVFLSLRNFLHERQRKNDPIGFRVFEVVRTALRRGVESGWIEIVEGDARIRSDTWLSFSGRGSLPGDGHDEDLVLADIASSWAADLLPELVTTRGRGYARLIDRLVRRIRDLSTEGIDGFRATALVDALKAAVRSQWASFVDSSLGEKGYESSDDDLLVVVRKTFDSDRVEATDNLRAGGSLCRFADRRTRPRLSRGGVPRAPLAVRPRLCRGGDLDRERPACLRSESWPRR